MAEAVGELLQRETGESELFRSVMMSPFREMEEVLLNGGIHKKEDGRVVIVRRVREQLEDVWRETPGKRGGLWRRPEEEQINDTDRNNPEVREFQDKFRQLVKWMVDEKLVDNQTALAAGKLVRPSLVGLGNKLNTAAYFKLEYPEDGQMDQAGIRFNPEKWKSVIVEINRATKGVVELSEDEVRDWTVWLLMAHEYGHALVMTKAEGEMDLDDWFYTMNEKWRAEDADGNLVELLASSFDERVAVAMEQYVLKRLLEDKGFDNSQVDEVIWRYYASSYERMETEWLALSGEAAKNGLTIADLERAREIMNFKLADKQIDDLGALAGYGFPLSEEQLTEFLKQKAPAK